MRTAPRRTPTSQLPPMSIATKALSLRRQQCRHGRLPLRQQVGQRQGRQGGRARARHHRRGRQADDLGGWGRLGRRVADRFVGQDRGPWPSRADLQRLIADRGFRGREGRSRKRTLMLIDRRGFAGGALGLALGAAGAPAFAQDPDMPPRWPRSAPMAMRTSHFRFPGMTLGVTMPDGFSTVMNFGFASVDARSPITPKPCSRSDRSAS